MESVGRHMGDVEGGQVAESFDLEALPAVRAPLHLGRTRRAEHVLADKSGCITEVLQAHSALKDARHDVGVRRRTVAVLRGLARWRR